LKPVVWAVAATALIGVGVAGAVTGGFTSRLAPLHQDLAEYAEYSTSPQCFFTRGEAGLREFERNGHQCFGHSAGAVLLWGDSTAAFQAPGLQREAEARRALFRQVTMAGCMPSLSPTSEATCTEFNAQVLARLEAEKPATLVLSAQWNVYPESSEQLPLTVTALLDRGFNVVVLGPPVQYVAPLPTAMIESGLTDFESFDTTPIFNQRAQDFDYVVRRRLSGTAVTYISIIEQTCDRRRCSVIHEGAPMTWDYHHLTEEGSNFLAQRVFPLIESATPDRAPN
jgi:hypothetical protein